MIRTLAPQEKMYNRDHKTTKTGVSCHTDISGY